MDNENIILREISKYHTITHREQNRHYQSCAGEEKGEEFCSECRVWAGDNEKVLSIDSGSTQ
jgi:hypothetical protein